MALNETLRKKLTPELYVQVMDALGDDFDFDMVPRTRLQKVIEQRNQYKAQLEGQNKPVSETTGTDSDVVPTAAPVNSANPVTVPNTPDNATSIEQLKAQMQLEQEAAIKAVRLQYAALDKMRSANIIDPDLVWNSNLLDKTKLDLNEQGQLTGIDEMITGLQASKPFLFQNVNPAIPRGTGMNGAAQFAGVSSKADFLKLPAEQQIAFKQQNPSVFQQFMNER